MGRFEIGSNNNIIYNAGNMAMPPAFLFLAAKMQVAHGTQFPLTTIP